MHYVSFTLCALVPYVPRPCRAQDTRPRASRTSYLTFSRAPRALCYTCPTLSRASRASYRTCCRASRASCHACHRAWRASCLTCLVLYVLLCSRALWPTCSRVSRVLRTLVPHVSFALPFHVLLLPRAVRFLLLFTHTPLFPGVASLTYSYASHVL